MNALTNVNLRLARPYNATAAWPENMQLCTPAILYAINMYVFRTIVLAAVVGRPAYQFICERLSEIYCVLSGEKNFLVGVWAN